jgi:hypothetical protein
MKVVVEVIASLLFVTCPVHGALRAARAQLKKQQSRMGQHEEILPFGDNEALVDFRDEAETEINDDWHSDRRMLLEQQQVASTGQCFTKDSRGRRAISPLLHSRFEPEQSIYEGKQLSVQIYKVRYQDWYLYQFKQELAPETLHKSMTNELQIAQHFGSHLRQKERHPHNFPQHMHGKLPPYPNPELYHSIPDGEFILWEFKGAFLQMSAFQGDALRSGDDTLTMEGTYGFDSLPFAWYFMHPKDRLSSGRGKFRNEIQGKTILNGTYTDNDGLIVPIDYVVFAAPFFDQYQHLLLDHIGYLAYLRKTLPPQTRVVLFESQEQPEGERLRHIVNEVDSVFAKRIEWVTCESLRNCNQLVQVSNGGGKLRVLKPIVSTRHLSLLNLARGWILETMPSHQQLGKETRQRVIYYSRRRTDRDGNDSDADVPASNKHMRGVRAMDQAQEQEILKLIQNIMRRFGHDHELVVFTGQDMSFRDELMLFRSASTVIGPHGGGLANLLWLTPNQGVSDEGGCPNRPKVLEFVTNAAVPDVHGGYCLTSYYTMFATAPWMEYHQVLFQPPSDRQKTRVSLGDVRDALITMFGGSPRFTLTA